MEHLLLEILFSNHVFENIMESGAFALFLEIYFLIMYLNILWKMEHFLSWKFYFQIMYLKILWKMEHLLFFGNLIFKSCI